MIVVGPLQVQLAPVAPPANHPPVSTHFDLDFLRIVGVAVGNKGLAAIRDTCIGRQAIRGSSIGSAGGSNPVAWGRDSPVAGPVFA